MEKDLDQFDDLENDEGEPGSAADEADALPAGDKPEAKESKRVNDLTSMWQKAEARAVKAEALIAKNKAPESDAGGSPARDPEVLQWIEAQREITRERALGVDPRLAEYGFSADDITGDTPADVKASVKRYVDLIDAIETKARTRLLIEHGLSPEVPGGGTTKALDMAGMNDEDFEKLVQRTKNRL